MRWAIKRSFRAYVEAIGDGAVSASAGASIDADGRFVFEEGASIWEGGRPRVLRFTGAAEFSAHRGMLSLRIREPWLEFDGTAAVLSVMHPAYRQSTDRRLMLCTLSIPDGEEVLPAVSYDAVEALLARDAVSAFNDVYAPGTEMEPVSFLSVAT